MAGLQSRQHGTEARGRGQRLAGLFPRVMHRPRGRRPAYILPGFFEGVKQYILHLLLRFPPEHHQLVNRTPGNYMIQKHRPGMPGLSLTGRAYAFDNLLVLLKIPPVGEKNQNMTAILQIKAVPGGCRVSE